MSKIKEYISKFCPNGVEFKKIKDIVKVNRGSRLTKSQLDDSFIYDVYHGSKDTILGKYSDFNAPAGTIIIVNTGGIGGVKYIDKPFWCSDGSFWLGQNESINSKYLYYCLSGYEDFFFSKKRVGGVPTIDKSVVEDFEVPIPPLPIQDEIVKILDNFTELTAELTAELQERKKQYEYYRDSLLTFNTTYKKCKLIDILAQPITDGPHVTPTFVSKGIPFISAEAISEGRINFDKIRGYITEDFDLECSKKYKPSYGDVYLVKSGSTTGKVGYVDTNMRFNIWSPIAAMRVNKDNSSKYLYYLLQTKALQEQVVMKSSHGSQPNLSMRVLEQFDISVPSLEIQNRIVDVLDNFEKICNDLQIGLPAEIKLRQQQYEYYRDKLLKF